MIPRTRIRGRALAALLPLLAVPALAGLAMALATAPVAAAVGERAEVVRAVNAERAAQGCSDLTVDRRLTASAQAHAVDMSRSGYFSHSSKNGTSWSQRIENSGYQQPGGENIAMNFASADRVIEAWMDSPGHRRNIMDCSFRHIGVGYSQDGGYWVQHFG